MNAATSTDTHEISLVDIVDFKWLMAGDGHKVHIQRLQAEPEYARQCLLHGAFSRVPALRDAARRLAATMGIGLPPAA